MTPAAAGAEYKTNLGHDFTLADAGDVEYMEEEPTQDETAARQALNAKMAEWFGLA